MEWLNRTKALAPIMTRLWTLETKLGELAHGQTTISAQVSTLQARDGEIEGKLAGALDRFSDQLVQQGKDMHLQQREQFEMFRSTLLETSVRKAWVVFRGRGLRWGERLMWLLVAGLGKVVWTHVIHARGWDLLWWWPSW